jgi:hypothetical protein
MLEPIHSLLPLVTGLLGLGLLARIVRLPQAAGIDIPLDACEDTLDEVVQAAIAKVVEQHLEKIKSYEDVLESYRQRIAALEAIHRNPLSAHKLP